MNFFTVSTAIAALLSSASALITISPPTAGSFWYSNMPNYLQVSSDNSAETFATVRFSSCKQCFSLTVPTNASMPVVLPRHIRDAQLLNIYAISNSMNTATSFVYVANSLPCGPCGPVTNACATPCARRSRRCYAQEGSAQQESACHSELSFVDPTSEEAAEMQADQEQAARDLAEDLMAAEALQGAANNATVVAEAEISA